MSTYFYDVHLRKKGTPYLVKTKTLKEDSFLSNSEDVNDFVRKNTELPKKAEEHVLLIALNTRGKVTGAFWVSKGTATCSWVQPREVFMRLVLAGATQFITVHNHPSGSLEISEDDKNSAINLRRLGNLMGIEYLDSVIITIDDFVSIRKESMVWQ